MIGFSATKASFFDRPAVIKLMDAKTRQGLSRFGAFVRQRARASIRSRKKISAPGSPPSSHAGTLKRLIFFGFDETSRSVVVGPLLFSNKTGNAGAQTLEEGGQVTTATRDGKTAVLIYKARPYMKPAFDAELPQAAAGFAE